VVARSVGVFSGWGRTHRSPATLLTVSSVQELAAEVRRARTLLPRGLGRAYGDAATNAGGRLVGPYLPDAAVSVDADRPSVTAAGGVSLDRLLGELLPRGLMLPVVPGTRHVTVGGAIAADVHGKNHHRDSSLGAFVESLTLVDGTGAVRMLSPSSDPQLFWATVGGMGLTGVIVSATIRLLRVPTSWIRVRSTRVADFDELLDRLRADPGPRYQVAWVDCLEPRARYRAILDEGEHATAAELHPRARSMPLAPPPARSAAAPPLPANLVRGPVVRGFNALWWAKSPPVREATVPLGRFFFPLDGVSRWNRFYGPEGFRQYQFVVPQSASALLRYALDEMRAAGGLPALVVLKRMGAATPGPLSFPFAGWTLAVDLPAGEPPLLAALDRLDERVAEAGGRVYLAKDSRVRPEALAAMYPRLGEWRDAREALDPPHRFGSDLSRRTGL
jgi:decaprenylphospho-beta-D-ribofuranose 2-oxidase